MSNSFRDIYLQTVKDRNWVIPFGKYTDTPLHEVMANDPQYLQWLQNKGAVDFDDCIWSEMREMFTARYMDDQFQVALDSDDYLSLAEGFGKV